MASSIRRHEVIPEMGGQSFRKSGREELPLVWGFRVSLWPFILPLQTRTSGSSSLPLPITFNRYLHRVRLAAVIGRSDGIGPGRRGPIKSLARTC